MSTVLVVGADPELVSDALARAGENGVVVVLDPSAERLADLERSQLDARIWYLVGDADVIPLPSASVDIALGSSSPDVERVLR